MLISCTELELLRPNLLQRHTFALKDVEVELDLRNLIKEAEASNGVYALA